MTDLFEKRVAVFQMFLDFPRPYAETIRAFMRDILYQLENNIPLAEAQDKLLLSHDIEEVQTVLTEFARLVENSSNRLQDNLARGDLHSAYSACRGWADNYWRYYETVLDMYVFEGNPYLQEPSEVSKIPIDNLRSTFPVNLHVSGDPHEGRLKHFQQQLIEYGNPWA